MKCAIVENQRFKTQGAETLLETLSNHYGNTLGREVYIGGLCLVRLSSRRDIILKQFQ